MTDIINIFDGDQGNVSVWFHREIDFNRDDQSMVFSLSELRAIVASAEKLIHE